MPIFFRNEKAHIKKPEQSGFQSDSKLLKDFYLKTL